MDLYNIDYPAGLDGAEKASFRYLTIHGYDRDTMLRMIADTRLAGDYTSRCEACHCIFRPQDTRCNVYFLTADGSEPDSGFVHDTCADSFLHEPID